MKNIPENNHKFNSLGWKSRIQPFSELLNTGLKLTSKFLDRMPLITIQKRLKNLKKTVPASLNEIASPCLERYFRIRYWTQDESRFGLKTITRRRLTLKKVKPLVKVQWLFKAFYLYSVDY